MKLVVAFVVGLVVGVVLGGWTSLVDWAALALLSYVFLWA